MRTAVTAMLLGAALGCTPPNSSPDSAQPAGVSQSNSAASGSHPELEFFNSLWGKLEIELTVPAEKIGNLENRRAPPKAEIKSLKLVAELFNRESETVRELTPQELQSVAFRAAQITLRGESGGAV